MTKQPLTRYITTMSFAVVVAAANKEQAEERLGKVADVILDRCDKTTFTRLPGRPHVNNAAWYDVQEV